MKKFLFKLLMIEKNIFQTELSKEKVLNNIESALSSEYGSYLGRVYKNKFLFMEKPIKNYGSGSIRNFNSFVPTARGTVTENGKLTDVSVTIRLNLPVYIIILPLYLFSIFCFFFGIIQTVMGIISLITTLDTYIGPPITLIFLPIIKLLLYFGYKRPAKRLKSNIELLIASK